MVAPRINMTLASREGAGWIAQQSKKLNCRKSRRGGATKPGREDCRLKAPRLELGLHSDPFQGIRREESRWSQGG
jgi:hypothetical protein